jgi:hypothetical protein
LLRPESLTIKNRSFSGEFHTENRWSIATRWHKCGNQIENTANTCHKKAVNRIEGNQVKKHFFCAPAILVLLTTVNVVVASAQTSHQRWSSDPDVDHLKALQANIMKFEEYSAYCQTNPHENECDGINDHIPTQFMNYDEAVDLGNQHLEKEKQRQAQPKPAKLSLAESARQHQLLQKEAEEIVRDFCTKYPEVKTCSEKTPRQMAKAFLAGRNFNIEKKTDHKKP